jgi:hypothetical protein
MKAKLKPNTFDILINVNAVLVTFVSSFWRTVYSLMQFNFWRLHSSTGVHIVLIAIKYKDFS